MTRPALSVGCAVIAYEAASTIESVLDGLADLSAESRGSLLVADDHSSDATADVAAEWSSRSGIDAEIRRNEWNRGYGGNQKVAFDWAMRQGFDILVLLHGDGQHSAADIPALLAPILDGTADAVLGSRMMVPKDARLGGMPLHRYVGNRFLTRVQNRLAGTSFAEWHSGFRAYKVDTLRRIDVPSLSDWYDIDCQITLRMLDRGLRVREVACTTTYADEISRVKLVRYGLVVLARSARHRRRSAQHHRSDRRSPTQR